MILYKVPFRDVMTLSFRDWVRQIIWCHLVLRLFPRASEPVYHYGPFVSFGSTPYVLDVDVSDWMFPRGDDDGQLGGDTLPTSVLREFIEARDRLLARGKDIAENSEDAGPEFYGSRPTLVDVTKAVSEGSYNAAPAKPPFGTGT